MVIAFTPCYHFESFFRYLSVHLTLSTYSRIGRNPYLPISAARTSEDEDEVGKGLGVRSRACLVSTRPSGIFAAVEVPTNVGLSPHAVLFMRVGRPSGTPRYWHASPRLQWALIRELYYSLAVKKSISLSPVPEIFT